MLEDLAFGVKKDQKPQSCGGQLVCQKVKTPHRSGLSGDMTLEVLALWLKKTKKPRLMMELVCQQVKTTIGRRLLIVQTTRGDSLWVKGISEPRVRDTRVEILVSEILFSVL